MKTLNCQMCLCLSQLNKLSALADFSAHCIDQVRLKVMSILSQFLERLNYNHVLPYPDRPQNFKRSIYIVYIYKILKE